MNDEQATNHHANDPQAVSSREQRLVEQIQKQLVETHLLSSEAITQFLLSLPEKYQQMAIHTIAEQFVTDIKIHLLHMVARFYQQATAEGMDDNECNDTLEDVEADIHDIMMLNQRLAVGTFGDLFKLGKITTNVRDLSQSESAEGAQRGLYSVPAIYQGRLEREHLTREEVSSTAISSGTLQVKLTVYQAITGVTSYPTYEAQRSSAEQLVHAGEVKQWGNLLLQSQNTTYTQTKDGSIEVRQSLSS